MVGMDKRVRDDGGAGTLTNWRMYSFKPHLILDILGDKAVRKIAPDALDAIRQYGR